MTKIETTSFRNQFGVYRVPTSAYVDPATILAGVQSAPPNQVAQFVGYANINNALAFQAWCQQAAFADSSGFPLPKAPNYWTVTATAIDAYWNAVTIQGTGFDPSIQPDKFGLCDGVGGSFVPTA